jgi:hypothetical protein
MKALRNFIKKKEAEQKYNLDLSGGIDHTLEGDILELKKISTKLEKEQSAKDAMSMRVIKAFAAERDRNIKCLQTVQREYRALREDKGGPMSMVEDVEWKSMLVWGPMTVREEEEEEEEEEDEEEEEED